MERGSDLLFHARSSVGQQDLNPELSDSKERWLDKARPLGAPNLGHSHPSLLLTPLSCFPGSGLLGAFGPEESMGRRAAGWDAAQAAGRPWGGAREEGRWLQRAPCPHPTHPASSRFLSSPHPLLPAPLRSGKARGCLLPCWTSGNRPGWKETPPTELGRGRARRAGK